MALLIQESDHITPLLKTFRWLLPHSVKANILEVASTIQPPQSAHLLCSLLHSDHGSHSALCCFPTHQPHSCLGTSDPVMFPAWDPHFWFPFSHLPHLLLMLSIHITPIILTNCPLPLTYTLHLQQPALSSLCSTITFEYGGVLGCVWLFETPWTVACQAPLSMPFPSSGDLPNSELQPASPALTGWLPVSHLGNPPSKYAV